jgi:hypothetical protein
LNFSTFSPIASNSTDGRRRFLHSSLPAQLARLGF